MMFASRIPLSRVAKPIAVVFFLFAIFIVQGCGHHRSTQTTNVASHKVMLDREGVTNRFGVEERGQLAIFRYDGFSFSGTRLTVTIENDKVTVNDKSTGLLKQGDVVHIGDDGLTVNALDYGQSAVYLEANARQETAQKVDE